MGLLPSDANARKGIPLATGLMDYFPSALAAIANVSLVSNEQHNPGEPLHWARDKSTDHADALLRHFLERGTLDSDGLRHSAKVAWRALAMLETEIELEDGVPMPRNARITVEHRGEDAAQLNPAIDMDVAALIPDHAPPEAYAGD